MNDEMKKRIELYEKMTQEYNSFIEDLKTKTPEEIINASYQKVIKEEILGDFYPDYEHYDIEQIKALNKQKYPLDTLYEGWMDCDAGIHQALEDSTFDTLEDLVREEKQKKNQKER